MADWDRNREDDRSRMFDRDRDRDRDRGDGGYGGRYDRERGATLSSDRSFGGMEYYDRDRERNFGRFEQDRDRGYGDRGYRGQDDRNPESRNYGQGGQDWNRNQDWNRQQSSFGSGQYDWNRNQDWDRGREQGRPFGGSDWDRSWTGDVMNRGREMMRGSSYGSQGGYGSGSGYGSGMGTGSTMEGTTGRAGQFAGRGPKGWQRSDERIREDVSERLSDHPDVDASEIEVTVNSGEVTLRGSVDNRHEKRLAEDLAENVRGVKDVHNEIKVSRSLWQKLTGQGEEEQTDRPATERGARAGAIGGQGATGTGTKRA